MIHESLVLRYLEWVQHAEPHLVNAYSWDEKSSRHLDLLGYARWLDRIHIPSMRDDDDYESDGIIPDGIGAKP